MTIMLVVTTIASMIGGRGTAKAQEELAHQQRDNAVIAQTYQNRSVNKQLEQSEVIASINKRKARTAALQAEGRMKTQGRNIQGFSMDRWQQQVQNMLGEELANIKFNKDGERNQSTMSKKGVSASTQSRINTTAYSKYNPMNDILQGGLSIYSSERQAKWHKDSIGKGD